MVQTDCPIAFKTCDFVLDSKGRMTLLEHWELSQSAENLVSADLISSLDAARIIHTDCKYRELKLNCFGQC